MGVQFYNVKIYNMPESNALQQFKLVMKNLDVNSEMSEIALKISLRDIREERLRITALLLCRHSVVWFHLFVTPWTVAHQAPLSVAFPRQEYCRGLPFPSPGDLPGPGIKSPHLMLGR